MTLTEVDSASISLVYILNVSCLPALKGILRKLSMKRLLRLAEKDEYPVNSRTEMKKENRNFFWRTRKS